MDNSPRGPRVVVNHPAVLFDVDGRPIDCMILDVSREGFRLKVPQPLPVGEGYMLSFDRENHRVEIRWSSPVEVGGLFLGRIED